MKRLGDMLVPNRMRDRLARALRRGGRHYAPALRHGCAHPDDAAPVDAPTPIDAAQPDVDAAEGT